MINLLPPAIKEERIYGRRNRNLLGYSITLATTALATAVIMIGSLLFIGSAQPKIEEEIKNAEIEVALLQDNIKPVENIATRLDTAKELLDTSVMFSTLLPEIGAVLPEGVVLNALALAGGKTDPLQLDIDMVSADLGPILVRNLVESELFEAAEIASLTPKGTAASEVGNDDAIEYGFQASVTASFTGTAEAKRKVAAAAAAQAAAAAAAAEAAAGGTE